MTMPEPISRRSFLSRSAVAGGAVLLGAGSATGLAACSSSSSSTAGTKAQSGTAGINHGTPKRGGTAIIGNDADIDGFYPPSNHWDNNGFLYANCIYDPLMAVAADGSIQPYLCKSMTPNADYTVWTMTLRPGIQFHDGSALDATVVKNNYDALQASLLTGLALKFLKNVTVVDSMTVNFNLNEPYVPLPAGLATQVGYMVSQSMIDAEKGGNSNPTPVGTGPFVYSSWLPNNHFTAVRNPHYWRSGYPYLDQITFRPIPDHSQRVATLQSGGVDLIVSTDPVTITQFQGQSSYQVVDSLSDTLGEPDMSFIMLNCLAAPMDDLRIRQALAKGINYPAFAKLFDSGLNLATTGLFPPGSKYFSQTGYPTYDPAAAKALVKAYTAEKGTPTFDLATVTDARLTRVTQVLQSMWQAIGCKVNLQAIEQAQLISNTIVGNYQAVTYEQFAAPDPSINYVWWSTTTVAPVGKIALNFARNSDPQIEAALVTGRSSSNPSDVIAAYQKVNERLAVDLPYLWLGRTSWSAVADSRIQNFAGTILPGGKPGKGFDNGSFFSTQIWMEG